ncbi:MAG: hypothetical protein HPY54_00730 [Chthonomonadetes bacterium]|nr:hypothetical protein [Chthonomonadetes bacterium]
MTPATWWAMAFIAACVVLIVWVRVKYPLPDPARSRRNTRRRTPAKRRRPTRSSSR